MLANGMLLNQAVTTGTKESSRMQRIKNKSKNKNMYCNNTTLKNYFLQISILVGCVGYSMRRLLLCASTLYYFGSGKHERHPKKKIQA